MQSPHNSSKRARGARPVRERRDDDIMNTNDSSIVSKRSVSKLYFPNEPDFYEPFVPKFSRRNPLINRGYWLRMHAVEQVVRNFLEEEDSKSKVIVNLGCGYDPLPFQFWHRYPSIAQRATFVDVDYPQLIERKRDCMLIHGLLRDALLKTNLRPSKMPVYLRSDQYMALGCNLCHLSELETALRAEFDLAETSLLFVAEVSLTYMPLSDSDALIRWAATLDNAQFCLLEQYLPQGPHHPFAQTMLAHFDKLQTSIKAVGTYPSLYQQSTRFTNAGWPTLTTARNLWDLWSDEAFTSRAVRRGLDAVEPFDEWEEFALFAGHYFLLVASNTQPTIETPVNEGPTNRNAGRDYAWDHLHSDNETIVISAWKDARDASLVPRRFSAACTLSQGTTSNNTVVLHGGQGWQGRLSSMDVLARDEMQACIQPCTSPPPRARICHSTTSLNNNNEALLVGGRGSPAHAFGDCWLLARGQAWQQVHDLTPHRFRHSAVRLSIQSDHGPIDGVLVFGGKAGDGTVLDSWALWTPGEGWQAVPVTGPRPSARFGAAISFSMVPDDAGTTTAAGGWGLLVGGMDPGGTVCEEIWEWHINAAPALQLKFKDRTNDVRSSVAKPIHGRLGATLVPFGNSLLLIGGVSKKGVHGLAEDFLLISHSRDRESIHVEYPTVRSSPSNSWPLLIGTAAVAVSQDEIVVAGGGAVCFSMGSYWNEGFLTLTKEDVPKQPWRVAGAIQGESSSSAAQEARAPKSQNDPVNNKGTPRLKDVNGKPNKTQQQPRMPKPTEVPRVKIDSADSFAQLVAASQPAIIEGLAIGPCTSRWTVDYLKAKVPPSREVVIHASPSNRMTFGASKNFSYTKSSFHAFLDAIAAHGATSYLRATSSTQPTKHPTKLEDDFPALAPDFVLPPALRPQIESTLHSSPLRISGPVALWLHYDVLANILCQIRGPKTLHLFPPSDVKHFAFPPGGSSSSLCVDSPSPQDLESLQHTHPQLARLAPGDVLFIPPLWSHSAAPLEGFSVAVNVFWRDLEPARLYAAGRDVYGNRDLQAYENGRRDVERVVRGFRDVPRGVARFYLERLVGELEGRIGGAGRGEGEAKGCE